jgi:hypothetical protein
MLDAQFSIRDLFWAISLIATALGVLSLAYSVEPESIFLALWPASPLLGAGLGAPFRRKRIGAYVGLAFMGTLFAISLPRVH